MNDPIEQIAQLEQRLLRMEQALTTLAAMRVRLTALDPAKGHALLIGLPNGFTTTDLEAAIGITKNAYAAGVNLCVVHPQAWDVRLVAGTGGAHDAQAVLIGLPDGYTEADAAKAHLQARDLREAGIAALVHPPSWDVQVVKPAKEGQA